MKSYNSTEFHKKSILPVLDSWYSKPSDEKSDHNTGKTNDKMVHESLLASIQFKEASKSKKDYLGEWQEGKQFEIIENFINHAKSIRDFHISRNQSSNLIGNLANYIDGIEKLGKHWYAYQSSSFSVGVDLIYLLTRRLRGRTHKDLQEGFEHLRKKNQKVGDSTPMFEVNTPAERDFLLLMERYVDFFLGKVWYGRILNGLLNQLKNQFQKKLDNYFKKAREFDALAIKTRNLTMSTEAIMEKISETKNTEAASIKPLSKVKSQAENKSEHKNSMASLKPLQKQQSKVLEPELLLVVLRSIGIRLNEEELMGLMQLKDDEVEEAFYRVCRY